MFRLGVKGRVVREFGTTEVVTMERNALRKDELGFEEEAFKPYSFMGALHYDSILIFS